MLFKLLRGRVVFSICRRTCTTAAMTSFHAEKCCHLASTHEASARCICSSVRQFLIHSTCWEIGAFLLVEGVRLRDDSFRWWSTSTASSRWSRGQCPATDIPPAPWWCREGRCASRDMDGRIHARWTPHAATATTLRRGSTRLRPAKPAATAATESEWWRRHDHLMLEN